MIARYIRMLQDLSGKPRSTSFKFFSLLAGGLLFLVINPYLLILAGRAVNHLVDFHLMRIIEIFIAWLALGSGIFFLSWSIYSQWIIGKGTPAPIAPTQRLIIEGPYNLCRNPIQLGATLYYLGLGTIAYNITNGITCFLLGCLIGSLYHKFVEEKELLIRFGEEYIKYRERTPFLFPSFRKKPE